MICVYCDYKHGWCGDIMDVIDGGHGEFFRASNSIEMVQSSKIDSYYDRILMLIGCPSCMKVFMV